MRTRVVVVIRFMVVLLVGSVAVGIVLARMVPLARVTSAQGLVLTDSATRADPAAPVGTYGRLTYQGRLASASGAPINTTVSMVFKLYDRTGTLLWTSATRSITPVNGLFTVYLGEGADPNLVSGLLRLAVSLGVTVGGDAEMTPRQPLNSVVGHSDTSSGVIDSSNSSSGVLGFSVSDVGVVAHSDTAVGLYASTDAVAGAAIVASNLTGSGPALQIIGGSIEASGAGIGTHTFAFIHLSTAQNITRNITLIDNLLTNGDQRAMVLVTQVNNPMGAAPNAFDKLVGVYYDAGFSKWSIYTQDFSDFPAGITFNVMVIKR